MAEVPDHLLRRSRERRAALGIGGEEGAPVSAEASETAPSAAPATTGGASPAPAAAAAPAPAPPEPVDVGPPPALLKMQEAKRQGIPTWVMPVLVALPFWGILYVGAFGERHAEVHLTPQELGGQVYAANCASCHGPTGQGSGPFPAVGGGESVLTFPGEEGVAAHENWVREGSQTKPVGTPYGDPDREGGQRTVESRGMPGFAATLTDEEIHAVVLFEREGL